MSKPASDSHPAVLRAYREAETYRAAARTRWKDFRHAGLQALLGGFVFVILGLLIELIRSEVPRTAMLLDGINWIALLVGGAWMGWRARDKQHAAREAEATAAAAFAQARTIELRVLYRGD